ncbi:IS3 family transposase, partial [Klebsiella pneumoniae]|nr:IS3 family transposase [Klebsiella pneumoniae]
VIVHTERGGQNSATDYQSLLKRHNMREGMSARGCCYDNACAESCFHTLKGEGIHGGDFVSRERRRTAVVRYIECDYNR